MFASSVLEALRFAIHPADDAFLEGAICLYGVFPGSENIFLLPPFSLLKEKGGPVLMRFATVDCKTQGLQYGRREQTISIFLYEDL